MNVTPKVKFVPKDNDKNNVEKFNNDSNEKLITTINTLDDSAWEVSKN